MRHFSVFVIFCFVFGKPIIAQDLKFSDLGILQSHKLEYVDDFLSRKGWAYNSSVVETDTSGNSFKLASWSLNKNDYNEKAEGWLYLHMYQGYENMLVYQTYKENFERLKDEIRKTSFKHSKSDVLTNSFYTVYENGPYKVIFETQKKDEEEYSYGSDKLYYKVTIINYVEFNRRELLAEQLRFRLAEEKRIADSLQLAKELELMRLAEQRRQDSIKREEQRKLQIFLMERKTKTFDYEIENPSDYRSIENNLLSDIKSYLKTETENTNLKVELVYVIDTLGRNTFSCNGINSDNQKVLDNIKAIGQKYKLQVVKKNNYSMKAKAAYIFDVILDNQVVSVRKNKVSTLYLSDNASKYSQQINSLISGAPMGRFKISIAKRELNNQDFSTNKVLKYRSIGGPSNAFKSLLIPGWGMSRVSGGQKSGWVTAISVYGFIAASAGFKAYSISEYDKYHKSSTQTDMDTHFDNANFSNKAFFVCASTAAFIWVYDIIWVANKGFQNNREARQYKNNLSFYYDPQSKQTLFALNFKF